MLALAYTADLHSSLKGATTFSYQLFSCWHWYALLTALSCRSDQRWLGISAVCNCLLLLAALWAYPRASRQYDAQLR